MIKFTIQKWKKFPVLQNIGFFNGKKSRICSNVCYYFNICATKHTAIAFKNNVNYRIHILFMTKERAEKQHL